MPFDPIAIFDPTAPPEHFSLALKKTGRRRALFLATSDRSQVEATSRELEPIAQAIHQNRRDFAGHAAVALEVGKETGALLGAFLHRVRRGQGAGGVRHWHYPTLQAFLMDGLRLARGMGRKNALAGLWWGGGKGILCAPPDAPVGDAAFRRQLFLEYGAFISSLRGAYVTAEDVGTGPEDMRRIHEATRFATCVPEDVGGSGNPSASTARGVLSAMEAALSVAGMGELAGKTVAMQGTGNVGSFMIQFLLERGVRKIVASDVAPVSAAQVRQRFLGADVEVRVVDPSDLSIFQEPCDVFAPNALGGILNEVTIPLLKAPIVCGAANNQLLDEERDDRLLKERGILAVPDFVANRMGIVQCANEQYGSLPEDPAILRHFDRTWTGSVHQVTLQVLGRAKAEGITPTRAANQLADELSEQDHPLWPGRSQQILQALRGEGWEAA